MNDAVEGLNQIKGWSGEFNNTSFSAVSYTHLRAHET